jgi:hypothetical protein
MGLFQPHGRYRRRDGQADLMDNVDMPAWQMAGIALVCVIIGAVVATYLKPAAKPDPKRKNDE